MSVPFCSGSSACEPAISRVTGDLTVRRPVDWVTVDQQIGIHRMTPFITGSAHCRPLLDLRLTSAGIDPRALTDPADPAARMRCVADSVSRSPATVDRVTAASRRSDWRPRRSAAHRPDTQHGQYVTPTSRYLAGPLSGRMTWAVLEDGRCASWLACRWRCRVPSRTRLG